MDTRKVEKIAAIIACLSVVILSLLHVDNWESVGIYSGCTMKGRAIYPFFHANALHATLNAWCFISLIFIYDISIWRMIAAYVVAITIPVGILGNILPFDTPTVGLSGVVFFLFGSISFEVLRKWYFQAWMAFYLGIGFLFPNTNAWLHLYCYICGLVWSLLNRPIVIDVRRK